MSPDTFYEKNDLINFENWFLAFGQFYGETILNNFENQFCQLTYVTRNPFEAVRPVWDTFVDTYNLHGVLDISSCQMSHR